MSAGRPRVAIIGGGISGVGSAWLLGDDAEVHLFEATDRLGGHVLPVDVSAIVGHERTVDTAFMVMSAHGYPNVFRLMHSLGVATPAFDAPFCSFIESRQLFLERAAMRTYFGKVLADCDADYKKLAAMCARAAREGLDFIDNVTIEELFARQGWHRDILDLVLVSDVGTLWGFQPSDVRSMSARAVFDTIRFGGKQAFRVEPTSKAYFDALVGATPLATTRFGEVDAIRDTGHGVEVIAGGERLPFDRAIVAAPAPAAFALLESPTVEQRAALAPIEYIDTVAVLNSDPALIPEAARGKDVFIYRLSEEGGKESSVVVVDLNLIHGFQSDPPLFITMGRPSLLDEGRIDEKKIHRVFRHRHCIHRPAGVEAIGKLGALNEKSRIRFAGSYSRPSPSHEAAFSSAIAAVAQLRADLGLGAGHWEARQG